MTTKSDIKEVFIPFGAQLREGTHRECICRSCQHIAAEWSFCKPLISESKYTDDHYQVVTACRGYKKETRRKARS